MGAQFGHSYTGDVAMWRLNLDPGAQYITSDDNALNLDALVGFGNTDPRIRLRAEWQWCWDSFFVGPNLGYSVLEGKPWIGASLGYRVKH